MKVKIIFYSMYGHTYRMAEAVAEGAREVEGAEVELLQVAELGASEELRQNQWPSSCRMRRWSSLEPRKLGLLSLTFRSRSLMTLSMRTR